MTKMWKEVKAWWKGQGKQPIVAGATDSTNTLFLSICTLASIGVLFLFTKSNVFTRVKRALRSPRNHHHRSA